MTTEISDTVKIPQSKLILFAQEKNIDMGEALSIYSKFQSKLYKREIERKNYQKIFGDLTLDEKAYHLSKRYFSFFQDYIKKQKN